MQATTLVLVVTEFCAPAAEWQSEVLQDLG